MDRIIKKRGLIRSTVTRIVNKATAALADENPNEDTIQSLISRLEVQQRDLNEANEAILNTLLDNDESEHELEIEGTGVEDYDKRITITLIRLRSKVSKNVNPGSRPASPGASEHSTASGMGSSASKKKTYRLPKIEIKTFDGEILNWLGRWAQFQKIHENEELHDSDKFQSLMQAVVGQAKRLIEGFPQCSENYHLAIEALQRRFGNPSVLRTSYIRELTKVAITSVKRKFKLSELYDKLSSHRRALKTWSEKTRTYLNWID